MIKATVTATSLTLASDEKLTAGRVGLPCEFTFSSEWEGLAKTVTFESDTAVTAVMAGSTVIVPPEVFLAAGYQLKIAVTGKNAKGDTVIPTIWAKAGKIEASAATEEYRESKWQPTPDLAAQVIQLAANAEEMARSVKQAADNGEFIGARGEQGERGERGSDGFNGRDGADGKTPTEDEIRAVFAPQLAEINTKIETKVGEVKINGTALAKNGGNVELPLATADGSAGLVKVIPSYGFTAYGNGNLGLVRTYPYVIRARQWNDIRALSLGYIDVAVRDALTHGCDSVWSPNENEYLDRVWTETEKAAARERFGACSEDWSLQETDTGKKWLDGKTIYSKCIDFGELPNSSTKNVHMMIDDGYDMITGISGIASGLTGSMHYYFPLPLASPTAPIIVFVSRTDARNIAINIQTVNDRSNLSGIIKVEYTK